MINSDIVKVFIDKHWNKKEKQVLENVKNYIIENRIELSKKFSDILKELFLKIIDGQNNQTFSSLKYIDCCFLYTSIYEKNPIFRIYAYDVDTVDKSSDLYVDYNCSWLLNEFNDIVELFIREKNKYNIMLTSSIIEVIRRLSIPKFVYSFYCFMKYSIRNIFYFEELELINKEEKVDIFCGEYLKNTFNVYRIYEKSDLINIKMKNIKNIENNKSLFGVFNKMLISNIDFSNIDLRFSRFNKCVFNNCTFSNNELDDVEFIQCQISSTNFSDVKMYGISFSKCVIQDSIFYNINYNENYLDKNVTKLTFKDATFEMCALKSTIFENVSFPNAKFENSAMNDVKILNSDLTDSGIDNMATVNLDLHNTQL